MPTFGLRTAWLSLYLRDFGDSTLADEDGTCENAAL